MWSEIGSQNVWKACLVRVYIHMHEYERERVWLRLNSHAGERQTRVVCLDKHSMYGRVLRKAG